MEDASKGFSLGEQLQVLRQGKCEPPGEQGETVFVGGTNHGEEPYVRRRAFTSTILEFWGRRSAFRQGKKDISKHLSAMERSRS